MPLMGERANGQLILLRSSTGDSPITHARKDRSECKWARVLFLGELRLFALAPYTKARKSYT